MQKKVTSIQKELHWKPGLDKIKQVAGRLAVNQQYRFRVSNRRLKKKFLDRILAKGARVSALRFPTSFFHGSFQENLAALAPHGFLITKH